jgi:hypothetical protein
VGAVRDGKTTGANTMYAHTVVPANELQMNLKPVIEYTESLKQFCSKDKTAAVLLNVHTEALTAITSATKTPEQIQLNITNLERIKARLNEARAQRAAEQLAKRPQVRHFRFGVTA